jgi:hypothetical protein
MGRAAAIAGPVVAGYLLSANLPLQQVLIVIAAPDLVVAAACVGLDMLRRSASARADFARPISAPEAKEQLA